MTPSEPGVPPGRLRSLLAARVEATSLRAVAREVRMSASGLQKVLDGAKPQSATQRKLERWYLRALASEPDSLDAETAQVALHVFVHDLPPRDRADVMVRVLETLAVEYARSHLSVPSWFDELRDRIRDR